MLTVQCFLYGLFSFALALVVLLRGRRTSQLALGHHFMWLAAFGLLNSVYAWAHMFEDPTLEPIVHHTASLVATLALPASGIVLVRFGIGLFAEAGNLPDWMTFLPIVLIVPLGLLVAYGAVAVLTAHAEIAITQGSRYLLIFPGNVLAAYGCIQQWRRLRHAQVENDFPILLVTSAAFFFNAVTTGLVASPDGIIPAEAMETTTGLTLQFWRIFSISLLLVSVIGMMHVFEVERQQEIEQLEKSRHQAQEKLQQIHLQTLLESQGWLDGLVRVSRLIADMRDEDTILCELVSTARSLAKADTAALALREQNTDPTLRYFAHPEGSCAVSKTLVANPLILDVVVHKQPLRFSIDGTANCFIWMVHDKQWTAEQAAVVPLDLNGTVIGVLWVGRRGKDAFSAADVAGLEHLADQAVIALEHGMMAARLQSLAVISERSRIAREMHDGLAQLLGYLGLEVQTLEAMIRQGNTTAALEELAHAHSEIKAAHADVRQNILSLRTTLSEDVDLKRAMRTYVQEFGVQAGIRAELRDETPDDLALSPWAQVQLIRIVQEALTNVRKHACATHVQVRLIEDENTLIVRVVDDGIGLKPEVASASQFGLQTMRERAAEVGGRLVILSSQNQGTVVELYLPLSL